MTWCNLAVWRWKTTRQGGRSCRCPVFCDVVVRRCQHGRQPCQETFPGMFDADSGRAVTGFPRLFWKQAPVGGWKDVEVPQWVQWALSAAARETPVQGGEGAWVCLQFFFRHASKSFMHSCVCVCVCLLLSPADPSGPPRPRKQRLFSRQAELCAGHSDRIRCIFSCSKIGQPAWPLRAGTHCMFCDEEKMVVACGSIGGRKSITRSLKAFRANYEHHSYVYNAAMMRVPEAWRERFHAQALREKRTRPRLPRKATVDQQEKMVAEAWQTALGSRKRAFKDVGSKETTAYKKRRTADRNRAAKKFFLDNDLPKPAAGDIASNDAGLPRAVTSSRAGFVEQWCKFGSWAICKECHSLQPRPLEPVDTRRVAGADMTGKACKQCKGKHWVPQPEDIPGPLRKLSMNLAKVLRPLDLDVGPVKKANNGYRIHSSMTRLSWSKVAVLEKIRQAGGWRWSCFVVGSVWV